MNSATPAHPRVVPTPPADRGNPRPVVVFEQVRLAYGRLTVLEEVSVQIHQGEFWCLLGPNGEGKTTFIKALLGAVRPQRGKVALRPDFQRRTRLAFVPQEIEVNASLPTTVEEFVSGGFVGLHLDSTSRSNRLKRVFEVMGITHLRNRSLWALSGGQRQRALVARALLRDPLLLVVDEPTAGLDLAAASGLLETITRLNQDHRITVVFVTHDLGIAARHATHVALFRKGRVTSGALSEAFTGSNLERTFGVPVEIQRSETGVAVVPRPIAANPRNTPAPLGAP